MKILILIFFPPSFYFFLINYLFYIFWSNYIDSQRFFFKLMRANLFPTIYQSARLQWFSLITFCTTISSKSLYESPYYFWKEVLWITKLCLVDLENGPRIVHMDTEESFDFWNRTFALTWFLPLEVSISHRSGSVESDKG